MRKTLSFCASFIELNENGTPHVSHALTFVGHTPMPTQIQKVLQGSTLLNMSRVVIVSAPRSFALYPGPKSASLISRLRRRASTRILRAATQRTLHASKRNKTPSLPRNGVARRSAKHTHVIAILAASSGFPCPNKLPALEQRGGG